MLIERLGDSYFTTKRRNESARAAIFTRKVGHTQRGGRPICFDRFYAAAIRRPRRRSAHSRDMPTASPSCNGTDAGFYIDGVNGNDFRDRYGLIHARQVHPSFYDREALQLSQVGIDYLTPIFTNAIGMDDLDYMRTQLFHPGNLAQAYRSMNTDINKRICYLE